MMCEGILIKDILNIVNPNTNLFIGNSMAIREMDDLTININKKINIYSNRGASGIDGLVSTALGISSVSESKDNIAILGDLSFYYDMTSLAFTSKSDISLKLFILNNNGGGICKKLPVSNLNYSQFEKYWITPPNLKLHDISKSLNVKYHEIKTLNDLKEVLKSSSGLEIIDCKGVIISGIAFSKASCLQEIKQQKKFSIIYSIEKNEYNGKSSIEINVRDLRFD